MAPNDVLKRYLDAGLELTAMTQAKAEALVRDLVKAGEVQADQARETVADLLERSRMSTERLVETVRREVKAQITAMGLASKEDVERVEQRILRAFGASSESTAKKPPATKAAAKRSNAKRPAARKPAATKAAAKKSAASKSTATKAARKRSTPRASTAKKA